MFGQGNFMNLNGAGGQVRLAQAPVFSGPSAPFPPPAPAPAVVAPPASVGPDVAPAPAVSTGLSRGAQIAIGVAILGLAAVGLMSLTD